MGTIAAVRATTEVQLEGSLSDGEAFAFLAGALVLLALVGLLIWLIRTGRIRSPGSGD